MATTAANVAVRAATGIADMTSRWQLMIEAKEQRGGVGASTGSQPGNDARKPLKTSTRSRSNEYRSETLDTPGMLAFLVPLDQNQF